MDLLWAFIFLMIGFAIGIFASYRELRRVRDEVEKRLDDINLDLRIIKKTLGI